MFCLKVPSDPEWADRATDSIEEILVDHAHCEMKAASNAMSLATRIPHDFVIVRELVALAHEELRHFEEVIGFLEKRGLRLGPPPVDDYAAALRSTPPKLPASPFGSNGGIVDRLLVGALIEARSCERFKLLIERLDPAREPDLRSFYETLFAAEARHYRTLVDLATRAGGGRRDEVMARLERLSELEAGIVQRLSAREERAAIHG